MASKKRLKNRHAEERRGGNYIGYFSKPVDFI